jgi:hypothetical protein
MLRVRGVHAQVQLFMLVRGAMYVGARAYAHACSLCGLVSWLVCVMCVVMRTCMCSGQAPLANVQVYVLVCACIVCVCVHTSRCVYASCVCACIVCVYASCVCACVVCVCIHRVCVHASCVCIHRLCAHASCVCVCVVGVRSNMCRCCTHDVTTCRCAHEPHAMAVHSGGGTCSGTQWWYTVVVLSGGTQWRYSVVVLSGGTQ